MKSSVRPVDAFSLVEVTLALGILAFSLTIIASLLPIGLKSNQSSIQESRAAGLLVLLDSDLRNTYPAARATGTSQIFGLSLPYKVASGAVTLKTSADLTAVTASTAAVPGACTTAVSDSEVPVATGTVPPAPFQASVIYTSVPTTGGSGTAIQARLVVTWPAVATTSPTVGQLTSGSGGYLESFVTFPAP